MAVTAVPAFDFNADADLSASTGAGAFYWTDFAPGIVNSGREEQGSCSGVLVRFLKPEVAWCWSWHQAVAFCSEGCVGRSSSEGLAAMLSAENMRRPSSCQCSFSFTNTAPTRRVIAASLGRIPTMRVRRLITSLTRSSRLVLQTLFPERLLEVTEGQHVLTGLEHEFGGVGVSAQPGSWARSSQRASVSDAFS